ncbi:MAG TPA: hypothetical protein DDW93_04175 [Firmicutes bacterium]|nr:hypothetical protein [Bacillota bacterium]HBT17269.1 hypothetical protein [Bacillota bacterium]
MMLFLAMGGVASEPSGQWSIRINIPACSLELLQDGEVWREFPIAVGKATTPTPVGEFTISNIIKNPTWYPVGKPPVPPGAENPLGGYWLGLSIASYGVHGNNNVSSIGYPQSNGCIRMLNNDLQVLVGLVRVGTPVEIVYETVILKNILDKTWLTIFPDIYHRQTELKTAILRKIDEHPLLYPVHWEALWQFIGGKRPLVIEAPQKLPLLLDGVESQSAGFIWGDNVFLPSELTGIWGVESHKNYLELTEFMRLYAGQVYGIFDQQEKKISLYTLRIYCNGDLFPIRGWYQDEPFLPIKLVTFLQEKLITISRMSPLERSSFAEGEEAWVPLSVIKRCWPQLIVEWDALNWILRIDY